MCVCATQRAANACISEPRERISQTRSCVARALTCARTHTHTHSTHSTHSHARTHTHARTDARTYARARAQARAWPPRTEGCPPKANPTPAAASPSHVRCPDNGRARSLCLHQRICNAQGARCLAWNTTLASSRATITRELCFSYSASVLTAAVTAHTARAKHTAGDACGWCSVARRHTRAAYSPDYIKYTHTADAIGPRLQSHPVCAAHLHAALPSVAYRSVARARARVTHVRPTTVETRDGERTPTLCGIVDGGGVDSPAHIPNPVE